MKLCNECGGKNPDGSTYCIRCGNNLTTQAPPISCPKCGASNIPKSTFCEACGQRIVPEIQGTGSAVVSAEARSCAKCGSVVGPYDDRCAACGFEVSRGRSFFGRAASHRSTFWAGVLLIIAGISEIGSGVASFFRDIPANDLGVDVSGYVTCCAVLAITFGVVAIVGGYLSFSRRHFYLVLVGATVGILGLGFVFIGSIASLIALLLIANSKDDFED